MIKVYLGKLKVFVPQLIDKSPFNLAVVKILILPAMVQISNAIWSLHKVEVSYNTAYESTAIEYLLITNIFVEVHTII